MDFIYENLTWFGAAWASGGLLLWQLLAGRMAGPAVNPIEAVLMINRENAVVLDVREQSEFDQGHILNARLIPRGELKNRMSELQKLKEKPILVVCATGGRSASACSQLRKAGYTYVFNITGGMKAWTAANMPIERKA